jgi:hypothetical protein
MAFTSTAILATRLANHLKLAGGSADLADFWTNIISDSLNSAYLDIVSALMARGYTKAQVDAWDRGSEFETDIGLYWCLVKGAGLHGYDSTYIKLLDRRKELETVLLLDGSSLLETSTETGTPGYGNLDDTNDQFRRDIYSNGELDTEGTRW